MISGAVSRLVKGFTCSGMRVYATQPSKGRFREEQNLDVRVSRGKFDSHLLYAKVFRGRPPDYGPWVELYGMSPYIDVPGKKLSYFGSEIEKKLISLFSDSMKAGIMHVCYDDDYETRKALWLSVPPAATRLGSIMLSCGCCWFKDWYFPEGFMEGGMKIQGEKVPAGPERTRMLSEVEKEMRAFISRDSAFAKSKSPVVKAALRRARVALAGRNVLV